MTPTIVIDPEFKSLIPPLTADERATLEANIVSAGRARDPLAVWNGVLIDGHNRFEICSRLALPFDVSEVGGIESRDDAEIWIIRNQAGRRNLMPYTRSVLMLKLGEAVKRKAAANKSAASVENVKLQPRDEKGRVLAKLPKHGVASVPEETPTTPAWAASTLPTTTTLPTEQAIHGPAVVAVAVVPAEPAPEPKPEITPINTRDELAKLAGVSSRTLGKVQVIHERASDAVKAKLDAGTTTIDKEFKAITGAERKAEQVEAVKHASLPTGKYAVIVADPPWEYSARAEDVTHRAANPYPSMSIEAICAMPVMGMAADDAILWLWTTNAHIFEAADVASAWGFQPKTVLTWGKDRMGTGEWLRGQTEHCLMCVRGKPVVTLTNQTTLLHGPMREHSRKPDEFYSMVEALCPVPAGGRVELFSRQARPGWVGAGAEVSKFDKAA